MPAKISSDMPLPIPRSVICSPSHMMNALPVVRVSIVISTNPQPGLVTNAAPALVCFSSVTAMPSDCMALRMTVRYRVHCVIFLRPSSPSFCNFASGS